MPESKQRDRQPDLVDDLVYLRKSRGLTLDRLTKAEAVVRACGGSDQPIETVYERFVAALRSLGNSRGALALQAAYGIDDGSADELSERRAAYAASVNRKPDTIRDWEDEAIDELALKLLTAFYAGAPTPDKLPIPHGGFLLRSLTVLTIMRDRRFMESQQTRQLISLVDGAKGFVYGTYSPTILSDPQNCTVRLSKTTPNGVLHEVMFPEPLQRGQSHTFSFREHVPDEAKEPEPPLEDFAGQTFESPTLRYRQEVAFLGERPKVVWAYDKLSRIERPGEPEEGNVVPLVGDGGIAAAQFYELYGGLCTGIAWWWAN
jgi:hypothetical protein